MLRFGYVLAFAIRISDLKEWLTGDEIADFESRIDAEESESSVRTLVIKVDHVANDMSVTVQECDDQSCTGWKCSGPS